MTTKPATDQDPQRSPTRTRPQRPAPKLFHYRGAKRNQPCPCGSGKKFKRCCYRR